MENGCTVLLVEPDAADAAMIEDGFKAVSRFSRIILSRNVTEALSYLKAAGIYSDRLKYPRPDLVLCDFHFDIQKSSEFLQAVKSNLELRQIPVVIIASYRGTEEVNRAYSLGAASVIPKPGERLALQDLFSGLADYWCKVQLP